MRAALVDVHLRPRHVRSQPRAVRPRDQDVCGAVMDLYGDPNLRKLESPGFDEREVIVNPAALVLRQRLTERSLKLSANVLPFEDGAVSVQLVGNR